MKAAEAVVAISAQAGRGHGGALEAALLLAVTLVLAGIVLAVRPAGRTSRNLTRALGAIPVASVALGIVTIVSGSPDPLTLILLMSCVIAVLAFTYVQGRRLGRRLKAAQDKLRHARLNWQQRRSAPLESPMAMGRPEDPSDLPRSGDGND
jgi:CDP-diglyceride synthetase